MIDLCREHELRVCNSLFQKTPRKLITWRTRGTKEGDPENRQYYDQLDYITVPTRWQNGVKDCESDLEANIDSDHAPVWATCQFKLKK